MAANSSPTGAGHFLSFMADLWFKIVGLRRF
jgi:hypothetical protein